MTRLFPSLFFILIVGLKSFSQKPDACANAKQASAMVSGIAADSVYHTALSRIKNAALDGNEHCISFGKDASRNLISSYMAIGSATSGKVPFIANAFADLHNHTNNLPPDAGDLYGLININKRDTGYRTRFVITKYGTVYALVVTDPSAAHLFPSKYPPQPPAYKDGPPGLPVAIVDEAREMKYMHNCTDEMVLAFILEKYSAGVSLLKQEANGIFKKIFVIISNKDGKEIYTAGSCH